MHMAVDLPVSYLKHDVSETGVCLSHQVEPIQLNAIDKPTYGTQLSGFHLKTEISNLRNVVA
jgi:hypothetical protein